MVVPLSSPPEGGHYSEHGGFAGVVRTTVTFVLVIGAAALTLTGLNHVPDLAGANPRRVRSASSLSAVEARLGQGLLVPAYFPQWLDWPPASVRLVEGPPAIVAFALTARDDGRPALVIVQALARDASIPARLLPAGTVLESAPLRVLEQQGTLRRVELGHGGTWHELAWVEQGRPVVFRFRGRTADILRMARSLRKERP
jgi:hypothetical protein